MEDSIIVNYAGGNSPNGAGDRIEFTGVRVSDTEYPTIGLHEQVWINKEDGYSITLKIRKLDEDVRKVFSPAETACIN